MPLCRCGREETQHKTPRPEVCRGYDPMDFAPFDAELAGEDGMGCHCPLCNELKYAHGRHKNLAPYSRALHDALVAGRHVHVSWTEWTEKLRANRTGDEGPACYRDRDAVRIYVRDGMGLGVTPGGINGALARKGGAR